MTKTLLLLINRRTGEIIPPGTVIETRSGCIVRQALYVSPTKAARDGEPGEIWVADPQYPDDKDRQRAIDDDDAPDCRVYAIDLGDVSQDVPEPYAAT